MIWYSIGLSDGTVISAFTMKELYYLMLKYMRMFVGDTMKGDYRTIYGTFREHTYLSDFISDRDLGFTMLTSCSFGIAYYGSVNKVIIDRGVLK